MMGWVETGGSWRGMIGGDGGVAIRLRWRRRPEAAAAGRLHFGN